MKELTYLEKTALPYSLLLDPVGKLAAAYNATQQLITENASPALLAYAQHPQSKAEAFDPMEYAECTSKKRPLPTWATTEVQARMLLVYLQHTQLTHVSDWHAVPEN